MKFINLQILRSIAAISVVLYHINIYLYIMGSNNHSVFKYFGHEYGQGALFFFSISGFLMAYLLSINYEQFLMKRLLRIYPMYSIVAISVVFLKVLVFGSISEPNLKMALTLLPVGQIQYPIGVEWTLVYEVFFYFICSIFTFKKFKKNYSAFLVLWLFIIGIGYFMYKIPTTLLSDYYKIGFSLYNIYFILGGLTYYMNERLKIESNNINIIIVIVSIVCLVITEIKIGNQEIKHFILPIIFNIALFAFLNIKLNKEIYIIKKLIQIGDCSYALYLVHVPIITILFSVLTNKFKISIGSFWAIISLILSFKISFYLGKLDIYIHKYIKQRINKMTFTRFDEHTSKLV